MSDEEVKSKHELMAAIDRDWTALMAALDRLQPTDFTAHQDTHGWTVKDHLIHLTAWERSVLFLLTGRPRHAGLGVAEELYLSGDEDAINAAITAANQLTTAAAALADLRAVHNDMLARLATLDDASLQRRYRSYLPDEPGNGDGPPVLNVVYGNTAHHYADHLPWIEALVAGQA
ncbi:MAG: ClbS/DfsB family four-helix bundle protein [Caldilineaceae bacterium]|nr:ClbS/DfsB family four-helix bundle protein [Caldilineaceae bacterium]